jgi:hypothetical protein
MDVTQAPEYGADESLREAAMKLTTEPSDASEEIDRIIREVGPHHVAHFLTTDTDSDLEAAQALRAYLERHWPAYLEFIDRLIRAARRSENEDVRSDFGEA